MNKQLDLAIAALAKLDDDKLTQAERLSIAYASFGCTECGWCWNKQRKDGK